MHPSKHLPHRQPPAAAPRPPAPQPPPRAAQEPAGLAKLRIDDANPFFAEHVRQCLRAEAGGSPVAAALLAHVGALPNPVSVRPWHLGPSKTVTDEHGRVTL